MAEAVGWSVGNPVSYENKVGPQVTDRELCVDIDLLKGESTERFGSSLDTRIAG